MLLTLRKAEKINLTNYNFRVKTVLDNKVAQREVGKNWVKSIDEA